MQYINQYIFYKNTYYYMLYNAFAIYCLICFLIYCTTCYLIYNSSSLMRSHAGFSQIYCFIYYSICCLIYCIIRFLIEKSTEKVEEVVAGSCCPYRPMLGSGKNNLWLFSPDSNTYDEIGCWRPARLAKNVGLKTPNGDTDTFSTNSIK